jgi:RNA polymerase sigma-70 factor (sigma-E family)
LRVWARRQDVGERVDGGDEDFERYVQQRGAGLARTAAFLLGDAQLGEDLVQEVLARLSLRWSSVVKADNLDAYVHRALVLTATSWRRRRSWTEMPVAAVQDRPRAEQPLYDDWVLQALRALPPRQRAVVVLRHYADRTEVETARLMGVSVGTVKSQHAKAVTTLRARLVLTDVQEGS